MRKQESREGRGNGSWLVLGRQPDSLVVRVQPFVRRIIMGKGFQHPPCAQARIKSAETTPRLELINLRVVPSRAEFVAYDVEETMDYLVIWNIRGISV